jgi:hypothetical protein
LLVFFDKVWEFTHISTNVRLRKLNCIGLERGCELAEAFVCTTFVGNIRDEEGARMH